MEPTNNFLVWANQHGMPIPFVIITFILYWILTHKIGWTEREKYYYELLKSLGIWEDTLQQRINYYQEPGSEYRDEHTRTEHFQTMLKLEVTEFSNIKNQFHIAKIFLSKKSKAGIEKLIQEEWYISGHGAISQSDYLNKMYNLVKATYKIILKDASMIFLKAEGHS